MLIISIGGYFFVQSSYFDSWARQQVIAQLEGRFPVWVNLEEIDVQLLGASIDLQGLEIYNARYPRTEPAIAVGRLNFNFTLLSFLSPAVRMDSIRLVHPELNLRLDSNDKLNLSNMFAGKEEERKEEQEDKPPFSPVNLAIGKIEIVQGTFRYKNQSVTFDSSSDGLEIDMVFDRARRAYSGETEVSNFDLSINDFQVPISNLDANFVLFENSVELPSLVLSGDTVEGNLRGEISDLDDFEYDFSVELSANLPRLQTPDLSDFVESGQLQTSGKVEGRGGNVHYEGKIFSEEIRVRRLPFRDIEGDIEVDRQEVRFSSVNLNIFNGRAVTDGRLTWEDGEVSFAEVTARDIRIIPILRFAAVEELPINGLVDASMRFEWLSTEFGDISGEGRAEYLGNITGPDQRSKLPVPFTGSTRIDYDGDTFTFSEGLVDTPQNLVNFHTAVNTDGSLELSGAVESRDPDQLIDIGLSFDLIPAEILDEYPIRPSRDLQAEIDLRRARGGEILLQSNLTTSQLVLGDEPLGSFSGVIDLSPEFIELSELDLQAEEYSVSGSLRTARQQGTEPSLTVSLQLDQLPIERVKSLYPEPLPVRGKVSGSLDLLRRNGSYSGSGNLSVSQLEIYNEEVASINSQISFDGQQLILRDLSALTLDGQLEGSLSYNLEKQTFELDLSGEGLLLDESKNLQELIESKGRVDFEIEGKGPISNPQLDLQLQTPELTFGSHTLKGFGITGDADGEKGSFSLSGNFADEPFSLNGDVEFRSPYPFNVTLELDKTPIVSYLNYFVSDRTEGMSGQMTGEVEITGNLESLEETVIEGDFQDAQFDIQGYPISTRGPFQVTYRQGTLEIPGIELRGEKTDFSIEGSLSTGEPGNLDLKLSGQLNLQAVNGLIERGTTLGVLQLETDIIGTLNDPRVVGSAQLINGFFSSPQLPVTIYQAQGSFQFTANQVSIDRLTTQTEFGQLVVTGGIFLEGMVPVRWQVNAFGNGLRFEYPQDVFSTLDVDLDLVKSGNSQLISGAVYIRGAEYTQDVAVADLIFRFAQSQGAAPPLTPEKEITLDIDVEAYRSLRIDNNLADLTASGDFSIIGTLSHPVILGSLTIDEGTLRLEGNRYEITRGTVAFNNPRRIDPYLNFQAETEAREYTIEILIRGQIENLQVSFRSDPPLDTASVVSLLAAGQTQEEIFGSETTGSQTQSRTLALYGAGALLSKTLGQAIEKQTSRLFGFERFSVDPFLESSRDRDPGARITLGKQITRELGITYISNLGGELQDQTVIIQYRLTDWLTVVGTSQSDGTVALDFKLRKRF